MHPALDLLGSTTSLTTTHLLLLAANQHAEQELSSELLATSNKRYVVRQLMNKYLSINNQSIKN